ncbi:UPF0175 family protein [Treponema zioleckii]|uniref:UPF0175 family protein n=1 Tax=Treponema zioleckii TaxID=331680 RepID=UPI0018D6A44A|nr:UPF0175 family protein [Treponema zioleckii]
MKIGQHLWKKNEICDIVALHGDVIMCQVAIQIPEAVLYDTHMTNIQVNDYARKLIAPDYYTRHHVSISYCSQIAEMTEEDFIKLLGQNNISIFQFYDKNA